jgi:Sulfotransferase family
MTAHVSADVLYVGYPKAGSTFIYRFFDSHPEVTIDRHKLRPLVYARLANEKTNTIEKLDSSKVHVSLDEQITESPYLIAEREIWKKYCFIPNAWDQVKHYLSMSPHELPACLRELYPSSKVLMVIREQSDWLHSIYKYSMLHLPAGQRKFSEYLSTPHGIASLEAGHFDQTIEAYVDAFGSSRVGVLRFEDIINAPEHFSKSLCGYLGIPIRRLPEAAENQSLVQIAKLRKLLPAVDRLPLRIKKNITPAVKALASRLPVGRKTMLSDDEIRMLRSFYKMSNERTDKLLSRLSADRSFARATVTP